MAASRFHCPSRQNRYQATVRTIDIGRVGAHPAPACESTPSIVFASHGIEGIEAVCERALWFDRGRIALISSAGAVCAPYRRAWTSRPTRLSRGPTRSCIELCEPIRFWRDEP